jgi:cytoskeletal protein CcmA (bactofilin family)
MFTSKKDVPVAPAPIAQPQARAARSAAPSIINADLVVNGTLVSTGDIQVDGRIEGDVRSVGLVIGEKAFIHGEVCAEDVTVRGRVQGSIRARKVLLCSTSRVEGNILHEAFAVESGAFFEGNCRHAENPLADDTPSTKPPTQTTSAPAAMTSRPLANETPRPQAAN